MQPFIFPMRNLEFAAIRALSDNFMYLIFDDEVAISVDPVDFTAIKDALNRRMTKSFYKSGDEVADEEKCAPRKLLYNLTTHSHTDHAGGNAGLRAIFPETAFVSGFENNACRDKDIFVADDVSIECIATPCHTRDSFCFAVRGAKKSFLVTGDTVFFVGCGRFFEGSGGDMVGCFKKINDRVDRDALFLYGHDYRSVNVAFANAYAKVPADVAQKMFLKHSEERTHNPFYRAAMCENDPAGAVQELRDKKDKFGLGNNLF